MEKVTFRLKPGNVLLIPTSSNCLPPSTGSWLQWPSLKLMYSAFFLLLRIQAYGLDAEEPVNA
jgi:hypothetical protein